MVPLLPLLALLAAHPVRARVDTVQVPLKDGTTLHTIVHRPDDGLKHAAVLVRTPYGAGAHAWLADRLLPLGIALVLQDVRGQGKSTGQFIPFVAEQGDGVAAVDWITAQPWSDGRLGLWGVSYLGYAAYVIAETGHPAVRALVTANSWADLGAFVAPHGAMQLGLALPWMATFARGGRPPAGPDAPMFRQLPLAGVMPGVDRITGFAKRPFDWSKVNVPVLQIAGWNDYTLDSDLLTYETLRARHPKTQRALVIGPWAHNGLLGRTRTVGTDTLPEAALVGSDSAGAWTAAWFRTHLLGDGTWERPTVMLWIQGENRWTTVPEWRPAGKGTAWYLAGSSANGSNGRGALSAKAAAAAVDTFTSDPERTVPTIAGATPQFFPQWIGPRDRRVVQARHDVLVYTGPASTAATTIVGRPEAVLALESDAPTYDVSVTLSAVLPDGRVRHLTDGYVRVADAKRTEIRVPLTATAITLPKGTALRLEIAGSNFPRYDRNPGTGEDPLTATALKPVKMTVKKGAVSRVVMP